MKLKPNILPQIALGAGLAGFGLQLWLSLTGTDSHGLLAASHPAATLLCILIAAALLTFGINAKTLPKQAPYSKLFPASPIVFIGSCIAGAGIALSSCVYHFNLLGFLMAIIAAGCLAFTGFCRLKSQRPHFLFHGIITLFFVIHLVLQYRYWNTKPQLISYLCPMLASVFLMLAGYYRTTLDVDSKNLRPLSFFHWGAVFFCFISLASQNWLFYLSALLWLATWNYRIASNPVSQPMALPEEVLYCIDVLEQAGHSAYVVGGCVRDHLMGLVPQDYDLCTDATPEQICNLFKKHSLVRNGEKHGTIGVVLAGTLYEITTFRTEGGYTDSRHPDWVEFVSDIKEDLARRDFTVNAMAYSPTKGYVDPFGGQKDLENKILRAVGDAQIRFQEDALRILRGVRFSVRFGLAPEENTLNAMLQSAPLLDNIAKERIFTELSKLLPLVTAEDLLRYTPIITQIIPELAPAVDFQQNSPHHAYDVYTHTAYVVEATPKNLITRFAALLHDTGKPGTYTTDENGRGHFYGHAQVSAEIAENVLQRLKAPTALRNQVVLLIEQHMTLFQPDKKLLRRRLGKLGDETVEQLLSLQKADYSAKGVPGDEGPDFHSIDLMLAEIRLEGSCLTVKDLAITGNDLLSLGVEPGPHIGECMKLLLSLVQDEILQNEQQELLDAAKSFFE